LADALPPWSLGSLADILPPSFVGGCFAAVSLGSLADALPPRSLGSLVDALPLLLNDHSMGRCFATMAWSRA
jgi:hypothetical protein